MLQHAELPVLYCHAPPVSVLFFGNEALGTCNQIPWGSMLATLHLQCIAPVARTAARTGAAGSRAGTAAVLSRRQQLASAREAWQVLCHRNSTWRCSTQGTCLAGQCTLHCMSFLSMLDSLSHPEQAHAMHDQATTALCTARGEL